MSGPDLSDLLSRHGAALAACLPGGPPRDGQIGGSVLARRRGRVVLRLSGAEGTAVLKVFGAEDEGYAREARMLGLLEGTALAPALLGRVAAARTLVLEDVPGTRLDDAGSPGLARAEAGALGRWLAGMAAALPGDPDPDDWATHLARLPGQGAALAQMAAASGAAPPGALRLCRNDGHLGNTLRRPDGRLVGIDFEAAALRPEGWDLLLAARSLHRRYPTASEGPVADLVAGWCAARGDGAEAAQALHRLALGFARMTAGV